MKKFFNIAGPCLPEKHYMIPPDRRLGQIRELIDKEAFFIIHAPRQTGKTTLIRSLSRKLTAEGKYAAVTASLESFTRPSVKEMIPQMLKRLEEETKIQLPEDCLPPSRDSFAGDPDIALRSFFSAWAAGIPRPLVLLLDEADALPGEVLISVLRQLRDGYTSRPAPFPQSLCLVGMRDVRDYRIKVRDDSNSLGTSSPFNIKDESLTLRCFTAEEVSELLEQHTEETGQIFEKDAQAEIFHLTQGQPWLVNALANQLTTHYAALVKDRTQPVTREHVLQAKEILIERRDTHLDSLVDKLRDKRVKSVIEPILIGETAGGEVYDDAFSYTLDLGLVAVRDGKRQIANPIYAEIIPRVLTYMLQTSIDEEPAWYVAKDGTLDMKKLINGFIEFWRRHGEVLLKGMKFQEAAPHLVFMAFLQRIVNAGGVIEREFALGTMRADLFLKYGAREDVIEIKLQRTSYTLPDGLKQVSKYAKKLGRDTGYLVIFDPGSELEWEKRGEVEEIEHDGVRVILLRA